MAVFSECKAAARGRWPAIWSALGVGAIPAKGRHGPCPGCGGKDRFRLLPHRAENGGWVCGQGGNPITGDGFDLLVHTGIVRTPGEALTLVAEHLGIEANPVARRKAREAAQAAERQRLEVALAHELRALLLVLDNRIGDREIERDQRFREARPEWRPLPGEHWERERLAAQRITALLGKLYPSNKRSAA